MRRILEGLPDDFNVEELPTESNWENRCLQIRGLFSPYGEVEYQGEVLYRVTPHTNGMNLYFGEEHRFLAWHSITCLAVNMIQDGIYPAAEPDSVETPPTAGLNMSDAEVRRHYEFILTSTHLYPATLHQAMREVLADQPADYLWANKAKEVCALFTPYGDVEYQGEVLYRVRLHGEDGIGMFFGEGHTFLTWDMVAGIVNAMIQDGDYPAPAPEPQIDEYSIPDEAAEQRRERSGAGAFDEAVADRVLGVIHEYADTGHDDSTPVTVFTEIKDIPSADQVDSFRPEPVEDGQQVLFRDGTMEQIRLPGTERPQAPKRGRTVAHKNYRLFALLFPDVVSGKYSYLRMESDGFEPLSIERLYNNRYSIMHTFEQNGDLMRDPDMEILIDTEEQTIQAATYELSGLGIYQQVYQGELVNTRLQRELNTFLNQWLKNISGQGFEPVRATDAETEAEVVFAPASAEPVEEAPPQPPAEATPDEKNEAHAKELLSELMKLGPATEGGKQRITDFMLTEPTGSAMAGFVKQEYGIGGQPSGAAGAGLFQYNSDGVSFDWRDEEEEIHTEHFAWVYAAAAIYKLIQRGEYLSGPEVAAAEPEPPPASTATSAVPPLIRIIDECTGAHSGQVDMVMSAVEDEEVVGGLTYSIFEDVPHVSFIEVPEEHRRRGIGTMMLRHLQEQYPETEIQFGYTTDMGAAFLEAATYTVENDRYASLQSEIAEHQTEIDRYVQIMDNGGIISHQQGEDMDALEDEVWRLQQELQEEPVSRRFVRMPALAPEADVPPAAPPETETVPSTGPVPAPRPAAQNFRYSEAYDLFPNGQKTKYRNNIAAIKLLKAIEGERRAATPEEQIVLARYVGWGGLANAFSAKAADWADEYQELRLLLDEQEYEAALNSTITAYFTEPELIKRIYAALARFGFEGGPGRSILDPAMGTGNFFSVLPDEMKGAKLTGVELDSITGRIARLLYPQAEVAVTGYESTEYADSSFDVVMGNIPFNSIRIYDGRYNDMDCLIHDYFFVRSMDLVKPGGIIAFITSAGTLDKRDERVREHIAARAELIGAIRLPNTAFKQLAGTETTTDIIFLKKRRREVEVTDAEEFSWVDTEIEKGKWILYNSYFHEHPEMVLGEMKPDPKPYSREYSTVCIAPEGYDLYSALDQAIARLDGAITSEPDRPPVPALQEPDEEESPENPPAPEGTKNNTFVILDGSIFYCENKQLVPQPYTGRKAARIRGLCEIRNALLEVIAVQTREYEYRELEEAQTVLNEVYDRFVKKYGAINDKVNVALFYDDDQLPLLRSIEDEREDKSGYDKAAIFTKATIKSYRQPEHVDTAAEALQISLSYRLKVDFHYMSALTGKDPSDLIDELGDKIYLNPQKYYGNLYEGWEPAEEYLSGRVRDKLLYVMQKAEENPELFSRNVSALEAVQPARLTPSEISVKISSPWVPLEYYRQFMYETFEILNSLRVIEEYDPRRIDLEYLEFSTAWQITNKSAIKESVKVYQVFGTARASALDIFEDTLNQQSVTVRDPVRSTGPNGEAQVRYVVNAKETMIARAKQSQLKEAFRSWIWADPVRREALLDIYNERFNNIRPREYDGSYLVFPGMSAEEKLRPHQQNFAARVIYSGTGLAAHVVGAGKTAAMIAAAMYMRNLGIVKKPVFVVPNPLTSQWATEFYRFFPNANILVTTIKDFEKHNRNRFVSRIAMNDYDAVIIGHSQFERIPISPERQREQLQTQVNQLSIAIERIKEEKGENWAIKQMVIFRNNLMEKMERLKADEKKDELLTFEQLGIDMMFVDEAHYFKNCFTYTKMRNVAGVGKSASQRAFDMLLKCEYLQAAWYLPPARPSPTA